jgi:hypothetical protein
MKLMTECSATTKHGKSVGLPEGTEVDVTRADISSYTAANPSATAMDLMARCPGAKNPAPYSVDISDLWLAVD